MANLTNASDERTLRSRSLLSRRHLPSHANVRSTVQRIGSRTQPSDPSGRRTIVRSQRAFVATHSYRTKLRGTCCRQTCAALYPSAAPPAYRTAPPPLWRHPRSPPSPKRPAANPCCLRRYGVCDHRRSWRCPDRAARHPRWYRPTDCRRWPWCAARRVSGPCALFCGVGRGWRRACHCVATGRSIARRCSWAGSPWARKRHWQPKAQDVEDGIDNIAKIRLTRPSTEGDRQVRLDQ